MLFDLHTRLSRSQRFDVLRALGGEGAVDESVGDLELFDAICQALRQLLDAPPDQLVETLRRRLVEVGDALGILDWGGIEPVDELTSWDQVTDDQLVWTIGHLVLNEINAIDQGGNDALAEDLGRRILARPAPEQQRLLLSIAAIPADLAGKEPPADLRAHVDRVRAGDPAAVHRDDLDAPRPSLVVGLDVCDSLMSVHEMLDHKQRGEQSGMPDSTVSLTAPAVGELLAAWLLAEDAVSTTPGAEPQGFKGASSRTRARKARVARAAATIAIAMRAYMTDEEPEPPFL